MSDRVSDRVGGPVDVAALPDVATLPDEEELWAAAATVPDPEMPPLTIADLGILRSVSRDADTAVVTITPTYSGCPAVDMIEAGVVEAVSALGVDAGRIRVERVLAPAWTTDWITEDGRRKLAESGISPPRPLLIGEPAGEMPKGEVAVALTAGLPRRPMGGITCPRCGSGSVVELSHFSSTACKSLYRCESCREPFDHVKEL